MSRFADETAGDAPVRDISLNFAGVGIPGLDCLDLCSWMVCVDLTLFRQSSLEKFLGMTLRDT